jgi:hypothetical protein
MLLKSTSCDETNSTSDFPLIYDMVSTMDISVGGGRFGTGNCVRIRGNGGFIFPGANTIIVQGAYRFDGFGRILWYFGNAFGDQVRLLAGAGGEIIVRHGNTNAVLGTSTIPIFSMTQLKWISVKVFINDTAGYVEVRDGKGTLIYSLTGIDTKGRSEDDLISTIYCPNADSGGGVWHDDLMVMNTSGSAPFNDWTKDARLHWKLPNGVGNESDMTRVGGTSSGNFTAVNEVSQDGDTSYVKSSIVGDRDLYTIAALDSTPSNVLGIVVKPFWRSSDGGAREGSASIRTNSTTYDHADSKSLPGGYGRDDFLWAVNPNTGVAFTAAEIAALEIGTRVSA